MFVAVEVEVCLVSEKLFGIDAPLAFECTYGYDDLLYFRHFFSWDYFPVILFDVGTDFLDDVLMKVSRRATSWIDVSKGCTCCCWRRMILNSECFIASSGNLSEWNHSIRRALHLITALT